MQNKISRVKFEINGIKYATPGSISEITIKRFIKYLNDVVQLCPVALDNAAKLDEGETIEGNFNKLTKEQKFECFEYFVKVVAFWTGAPEKDLHQLNLEELTLSFWTLEYMFGTIQPDENFTGFKVDGVEYLLPEKHMTESTLIEFAESAQFQQSFAELKAGNYIAILDVMAVLCRPAGELYDSKNIPKRKRGKIFLWR